MTVIDTNRPASSPPALYLYLLQNIFLLWTLMSSLVLICVLPTSLVNKRITVSPRTCLLLHTLCGWGHCRVPLLWHMDCSPPGSSVHGISQTRVLEWVDISFSSGSSQPRDQTHISFLAGGFFTTEPPGIFTLITYFYSKVAKYMSDIFNICIPY